MSVQSIVGELLGTSNEGSTAAQFWSFTAPLDLIIMSWKLEDGGNMPRKGFSLIIMTF